MEFARRIHLGRGLTLYREHKTWLVDICVGGRRIRKSMGTEQLPEAILAVMQSQNILWPEGTPIAGTPLLRGVKLSVDGVAVQPTNGAQIFSGFIAKVAGPVKVVRPTVAWGRPARPLA